MPATATDAAGLAGGAALATVHLRLVGAERPEIWAAGLSVAAAVYPVARSRWRADAAVARELAGLAAYTAVGVVAARRGLARLAAAGWASHAVFDLMHRHSEGSRLPDWYPAACAGYDLVVAAQLARS